MKVQANVTFGSKEKPTAFTGLFGIRKCLT
jgi:hypothetical protein